MDFWISKWILDFKRISGFQSGCLDFIWTATILNIQLKCTHDAFLSAYMHANRIQSHRQFTATYIAHRQRVRWLLTYSYAYCLLRVRWLLYIFIRILLATFRCHEYSYSTTCSLTSCIIHLDLAIHHLRRITFIPDRRSAGYKGHSSCYYVIENNWCTCVPCSVQAAATTTMHCQAERWNHPPPPVPSFLPVAEPIFKTQEKNGNFSLQDLYN